MNPNTRKPNSSGATSGGSSDPHQRHTPAGNAGEFEDDDWDDFENSEDAPPSAAGRRAAPSSVDEDEAFFEDKSAPAEAGDSASRGSSTSGASSGVPPKGFLETLEAGLRSAGNTAQRYTRMGVARAGVEKLRYDLKTAHAMLGELAMRCWSDAPDLGLTLQDPAVADAVKKIKQLRLKIREKQARIAELKKEN